MAEEIKYSGRREGHIFKVVQNTHSKCLSSLLTILALRVFNPASVVLESAIRKLFRGSIFLKT